MNFVSRPQLLISMAAGAQVHVTNQGGSWRAVPRQGRDRRRRACRCRRRNPCRRGTSGRPFPAALAFPVTTCKTDPAEAHRQHDVNEALFEKNEGVRLGSCENAVSSLADAQPALTKLLAAEDRAPPRNCAPVHVEGVGLCTPFSAQKT